MKISLQRSSGGSGITIDHKGRIEPLIKQGEILWEKGIDYWVEELDKTDKIQLVLSDGQSVFFET